MSWSECPEAVARAGGESAVELVLKPATRDLGGLEVRRALPSGKRQMVGPFIFFDQMGPSEFTSGGIDVRPHPHIGLATITYLFDGVIMHRDSLGNERTIRPGDVNWMKAGRGIVHSERTPLDIRAQDGHRLSGIQAWVALPIVQERAAPDFIHYPKKQLPRFDHRGADIALIAGSLFGRQSPVAVDWPIVYAEIRVRQAADLTIAAEYEERAIYIVEGQLSIADEQYEAGRMVILKTGLNVPIQAGEPAHFMLLGGKSMDGPRHIWWNFVASDMQLIEKAKSDWKAERFEPVPGETERIQLPD